MHISPTDIDRLLKEPSPKVRSDIAGKIALELNSGTLSPKETEISRSIIRILAKDTEPAVRRAISEVLADNFDLPQDLTLTLARDVAEVSVPMLSRSQVLAEEDLIDICRATKSTAKWLAIAQRETVSRPLAATLLACGDEAVMRALFANKGASLDEAVVLKLLESIDDRDGLIAVLIQRGGLTRDFALRLFAIADEANQQRLALQYKLPCNLVEAPATQPTAFGTFSVTRGNDAEVLALTEKLHTKGELTHSAVMRALCAGDVRFFEAAAATLAAIPLIHARLLLLDPGGLGFKALYEATALPSGFFDAIRVLYTVSLFETDFGKMQHDDHKRRIIQTMVSEHYDHTVEHMPYLMSLLGSAEHATSTAA